MCRYQGEKHDNACTNNTIKIPNYDDDDVDDDDDDDDDEK